MHPRRRLAIFVGGAAALIGIAWAVLYRRHVLAPPVEWGKTRAFTTEVSQRLESAMRGFTDFASQRPTPPAAKSPGSDAVIAPEPVAPATETTAPPSPEMDVPTSP
ncbi:hypothetical protein HY632_01640 [Candidatus Uhrbacteria bacterium]|nr:hypothetical protein [Candidatus Uhrbacteria bacterium]